jgi:hypothetical protein
LSSTITPCANAIARRARKLRDLVSHRGGALTQAAPWPRDMGAFSDRENEKVRPPIRRPRRHLMLLLLGHPLDGEPAERRVFAADGFGGFVIR